jgi:hypothetical protein
MEREHKPWKENQSGHLHTNCYIDQIDRVKTALILGKLAPVGFTVTEKQSGKDRRETWLYS